MAEFARHGDAEALAIYILTYLTPEIDDLGFQIASDLRGYTQGDRWIVVSQEGSTKSLWNIINKPRLDFDIRAESRTLTKDVSEIVEASLFRAVGTAMYGATLSSVSEEMGITKVPDRFDETSYRYIFSVRFVCNIDPSSMTPLPS